MLNMALAYAAGTTAFAEALIFAAIAIGRSDPFLRINAGAFALFASSFMLMPLQASVNPWIGFVLTSALILSGGLFLNWGLGIFIGRDRAWPLRYWLYPVAAGVGILVFTFGADSYRMRAIIVSAALVVFSIEYLAALNSRRTPVPVRTRVPVSAFFALYALFHLSRIAILFSPGDHADSLMYSNPVTTGTFLVTLFCTILLAGSIMILDNSRLMQFMEKKNQLLEGLAMHDELTGVYNRHSLERILCSEMERQDRYTEALSLIMMDIDHFKQVNDTWGHDAGDRVLSEMVRLIRESIRETDLLFRWGGEEFLILAPHTNLAGAAALAEKLRAEIADNPVDQVGKVTASFGAAERGFRESRDDWFRRVDGLLYQAKRHGRNRVESRETSGGDVPERIHIGWQKEWESGVLQIDHAHRNIIRMGSTLLNLSLTGCPTAQMLGHLDTLLEYIGEHIGFEEGTLEDVGYPEIEEHRKMHAILLREANDLRKQYLAGTGKPEEIFHVLVNRIIIDHIIKTDERYYRFTRQH